MENDKLGIKFIVHVPNVKIRSRTMVQDVGNCISELKWSWPWYLPRKPDDRWSKATTEWRPKTGYKSVRRPAARWSDDIANVTWNAWLTLHAGAVPWRLAQELYLLAG